MVQVSISCHANLQALQDRSDRRMFLKLVSLESVGIATDSYALLRNLIERRNWRCPQIGLLSFVAGVALELHKMKHHLSSLKDAMDGFPKALILLKNSAVGLEHLGKKAKKRLVEDGLEGEFLDKVRGVGAVLKDNADEVLKGTHKFALLQERVPSLLVGIDVLLSTHVYFPDPE